MKDYAATFGDTVCYVDVQARLRVRAFDEVQRRGVVYMPFAEQVDVDVLEDPEDDYEPIHEV